MDSLPVFSLNCGIGLVGGYYTKVLWLLSADRVSERLAGP